jgi:hypothetical protein
MKAAGVEPDDHTAAALGKSVEGLARARTRRLNDLIGRGTEADVRAAWTLLSRLVERGMATAVHFNVMLKACRSSREIRRMIDVAMPRAGVRPGMDSFHALVTRMAVEGDDAGARAAWAELVAQHLGAPRPTPSALALSETTLRRMRTRHLDDLLRGLYGPCDEAVRALCGDPEDGNPEDGNPEDGNPEDGGRCATEVDAQQAEEAEAEEEKEGAFVASRARTWPALGEGPTPRRAAESSAQRMASDRDLEEAWRVYDGLAREERADRVLFNVMLKACRSSGAQRRLISAMPSLGLRPGADTFNTLIARLRDEGNDSAADRVRMEEMPAAGVAPDDRTAELMLERRG